MFATAKLPNSCWKNPKCTVFTSDSIYAIVRICYRQSVRLSVTRVDQSKTVEARITKFSPYSSPIPLVFWEQVSSRNSEGFPRVGALNKGGIGKVGNFGSCHISEKVQKSYYWSLVGMCTRAFHWYQNQRHDLEWPPDTGLNFESNG